MGELLFFGALIVVGFPFLVFWMASSGLRSRVSVLEESLNEAFIELRALRAQAAREAPAAAREQSPATAPVQPRAPAPPPVVQAPPPAPAARPPAPATALAPAPAAAPVAQAARPQPPSPPPPPPPRPPAQAPAWLRAARQWLFSGNLVAKLGLLILFIGVSFLLKYASERVTVPIELRLAGIVVADIALLAWGWRLRLTRPGISLPIQGAALGILMLVTFGAFRLYGLIPSSLAFGLLFVLTAFTCVLAVLQNAFWLAAFGIVGGFVSPIVTSTGQGSHIALFGYYALLNAGVLAIALKRTWRSLNLIGFAFTFAIGTTWGVLRYSSDQHYLSTQLFLLLFFVYYVAIAVVYATRQSLALKAYVDATIVFGTPLAAFGLQLGLMKNVEFGNAWSALGFGLFYTSLALALWRRRGTGLKMLVESFLALGIVFGTLAIPFALDGRWTSAAWALEGAGVAWAALRQRQRLPFWFGMLVQAGAWISFIGAVDGMTAEAARDGNLWLGFLILAASAFFMAVTLRKEREGGQPAFPRAANGFLAGAAVWLLAGAWTEIVLRQSGATMANLLVASGLGVAGLLAVIAARLRWFSAGVFSLMTQGATGVALVAVAALSWDWTIASPDLLDKPLPGALMIVAAALYTSRRLARMASDHGMEPVSRMLLAWAAFWWFGPVLAVLSGFLFLQLPPQLFHGHGHWALQVMLVSISAAGATVVARRMDWADARWLGSAAWIALALTTFVMLAVLYIDVRIPGLLQWLGLAIAWLSSEYLLRTWRNEGWPLPVPVLKALHLVRIVGPWLMLWRTGQLSIDGWLAGSEAAAAYPQADWLASASWANFVPAWLMMAVAAWLAVRARDDRWPAPPLAGWYRSLLIPLAAAWSLVLAGVWNLIQDGSMAPLPYVPGVNPLDLTTGFAFALGVFAYRTVHSDGSLRARYAPLLARLPLAGAVAAYVWFNLILLRTASHVLEIDYNASVLFDSVFVQAMLSLVWSVTALVLMRRAVARASRQGWMVGAGFLALVVAKLFLVDLEGTGSVARIVSFVGVGLLMVLIGYLAPYPTDSKSEPVPQGA